MVTAKDVGEAIKEFITKTDEWREGLYFGIWAVVVIILFVSAGDVNIPFPYTAQTYWCQRIGCSLGFPSYQRYDIKLTTNGVYGDCVDINMEKPNGQKFSGRYCVKDKIVLDGFIVEVSEIRTDPSLIAPILFKYYSHVNVTWLFIILAFGLPIYITYEKASRKARRRKEEEESKEKEEIRKSLKLSKEKFDKLEKFLKKRILEE
jgi:large-conductance mechanosensitive channel